MVLHKTWPPEIVSIDRQNEREGDTQTTYTVILRAWGNELAARWDGRGARMAAIYMVLITPHAPEEVTHTG